MPPNLHITQEPVNRDFAYCAMEARRSLADKQRMRIRLREFRERLGITLEEMTERSTFSLSQLSRWETGDNNIPSSKLPQLAEAYGCSVGDIFADENDEIASEQAEVIDLWERIADRDRPTVKDVMRAFVSKDGG